MGDFTAVVLYALLFFANSVSDPGDNWPFAFFS